MSTSAWAPAQRNAQTLRQALAGYLHQWRKHFRLQMRRPSRNLELQETLALGEKRFVAVVAFGEQRFLIGGAANSVSLLATLPGPESFQSALRRNAGGEVGE